MPGARSAQGVKAGLRAGWRPALKAFVDVRTETVERVAGLLRVFVPDLLLKAPPELRPSEPTVATKGVHGAELPVSGLTGDGLRVHEKKTGHLGGP